MAILTKKEYCLTIIRKYIEENYAASINGESAIREMMNFMKTHTLWYSYASNNLAIAFEQLGWLTDEVLINHAKGLEGYFCGISIDDYKAIMSLREFLSLLPDNVKPEVD